MKLVTIEDLKQPSHERRLLIDRAMQLGKWYGEFKATDNERHRYEVSIVGEKQRAAGIHASEISKCLRLLVYSIAGVERRPVGVEETNVNMRQRFSLGHAVHAMVQDDFKRMCTRFGGALTFEEEVGIHPGLGGFAQQWNIHSSCDGVFNFFYDGTPYLRIGFEIKTKSAPEFDKLVRPDEDHLEQTCVYQRTLDLPLMWVFYYNKSNSNWTNSEPPWLFQFDEYLWSTKLEPRFHNATTMVSAGTLPPREEGMQCKWCPFAWTCQPSILKAQNSHGPSTHLRRPGAIRVP